VFGDEVMIKSVLANLYGRVNYGINLNDSYSFTYIDEAAKMMAVLTISIPIQMPCGGFMIMAS
jgi:hypothetical protein